jgi:hypothetical protein
MSEVLLEGKNAVIDGGGGRIGGRRGGPGRSRETGHMNDELIHPAVRVGHVHLRVADLDRALVFYRDAPGFGLFADGRSAGLDVAFLAAHR